jgi:hypothetical protein
MPMPSMPIGTTNMVNSDGRIKYTMLLDGIFDGCQCSLLASLAVA